jgi:hypothetical protein
MKAIREEFDEILKHVSKSIDGIINIDNELLFNSFGIIKQKIYDLIYKTLLYIPISENAKMQYLEHINFMFTKKEYYSNDCITTIGINNYNDLNYIINEHIEFLNKVLDSYSIEIGKKVRENKPGPIIFLTQYIHHLKRLSILKDFGIKDNSIERPFDEFFIATIENELLLQKELNTVFQKQDIKPSKKQALTTYNWLSNPDKELPVLYDRMKERFIAKTDFESFRAIFTGQPVQSITNKLNWLYDNTLLAYFLSTIVELKKISKKSFFAKAKYCFNDIEELKQSKLNYKTFNTKSNYKPKDYQLIDDLLKGL